MRILLLILLLLSAGCSTTQSDRFALIPIGGSLLRFDKVSGETSVIQGDRWTPIYESRGTNIHLGKSYE